MNISSTHILTTKNFIMRQVTHDDVDSYVTFWNDPSVMKFIGDGTWAGGKDVVTTYFNELIADYKSNPQLGYWAVVDLHTGKVIGDAGLGPVKETGEIQAGYLLHKDYWGKGYGTEILTALLDYGFKKLKLKQIIAVAHPENHGSIKIMQKCGMIFEKTGWYNNRHSVKYVISC